MASHPLRFAQEDILDGGALPGQKYDYYDACQLPILAGQCWMTDILVQDG
jgi:hypothetical protein